MFECERDRWEEASRVNERTKTEKLKNLEKKIRERWIERETEGVIEVECRKRREKYNPR